MSIFSLKGEIALITGGATGIGYSIAECMIKAGAKVVIVSRNEENLKKAKEELGENCFYRVFDITNFDKVESLINEITETVGNISILVNNAGNHFKKSFLETDINDFDSVLKTHLYASFELSKYCARKMVEKGHGNILFIASMTSFIGQPLVVSYSAAKSAYLGMVRTLASELSEKGLRINGIAPGWIKTEMTNKALNSDLSRKNKVLSRTPMNRLGDTEDIGWGAVYLCSKEAKFTNGTILTIDGGASIGF